MNINQASLSQKDKEKKKQRIKEKCFSEIKEKILFFEKEQIEAIYEIVSMFMDERSLLINFYEIYNFYKVYKMDQSDKLVFQIIQQICDEINAGNLDSQMFFYQLVEQLDSKLGHHHTNQEQIFNLLKNSGSNLINKDDIQQLLKSLDIETSSQQIAQFLSKIASDKKNLDIDNFHQLYKTYYNIQNS